jgi:hypothetical protein
MDSDILFFLYWVIVVVAVVGSFVLGMYFYVWTRNVLAGHAPRKPANVEESALD